MNLFEEIIEKHYDLNIETLDNIGRRTPRMSSEKLEAKETNDQPSSLAQYIMAPFILVDSNGINDIPVFDKISQEVVLEEIAPHFSELKKITIDDQLFIRVQNVKESSKNSFLNLVKNNRLNKIVNDIYSNRNSSWPPDRFIAKEYKVNLEIIEKSFEPDILVLWDFFKRSFIKENGFMSILPSGWTFDESFKDRIAVRAFASVCNSMEIVVNEDNNTISSFRVN
ncbi:hypothetical protein [Heyndrickxia oleronia]|uniref:Uncharacterized protein n=1 Tax=Heyndrickxia oleronia TaxID=38875 RepID=A0AAW6SNJ0_9BACI|nr:hypothetical protein [Heyndrickxia oleronia]MDH5160314.1 hypothetical protein [Heyndrickxia oleronia]